MRARSQQRSGQLQARLPYLQRQPRQGHEVRRRVVHPQGLVAQRETQFGGRVLGVRMQAVRAVQHLHLGSQGKREPGPASGLGGGLRGDLVDVQPVQRFAIPCLGLAGSQQAQAALASRLQAEYGRQRQERSQRGIRFAVEGAVIDPRLHQHRVGILVDQQQRGLALALHEHQAGALRGHSGLARRREAKHGQQRERAPTGHGSPPAPWPRRAPP